MTDHTINYSGLTPEERYVYGSALGVASLTLEWLQQPAVNEAFRSWVARTHPDIAAANGTQLTPASLQLLDELFATQMIIALPPAEFPDDPRDPETEIADMAAKAKELFTQHESAEGTPGNGT